MSDEQNPAASDAAPVDGAGAGGTGAPEVDTDSERDLPPRDAFVALLEDRFPDSRPIDARALRAALLEIRDRLTLIDGL